MKNLYRQPVRVTSRGFEVQPLLSFAQFEAPEMAQFGKGHERGDGGYAGQASSRSRNAQTLRVKLRCSSLPAAQIPLRSGDKQKGDKRGQ